MQMAGLAHLVPRPAFGDDEGLGPRRPNRYLRADRLLAPDVDAGVSAGHRRPADAMVAP